MHTALRRACVCALRGGLPALRSPARNWGGSAAARTGAPTHTDSVSAAIRNVIVGPAPATARRPGRRRPRPTASRAARSSEPAADALHPPRQQHGGRLRIRQALAAKLESELQRADAAPPHQHDLVRELTAALRSLGAASDPAQAPVVAAWDLYAKVAAHPDAGDLLGQIPPPAVSLLVCELIFMRGSTRYHWRFEQALRIFADFRALGRPMDTEVEFSLYLRAMNRLGKHQQVIEEVAKFDGHTQRPGGDVLSVTVMRQVITAYFNGNRPDRAMDTFQAMRRDERYNGAITPHLYATVLRGALLAGRLSNAELLVLVEELLDVLHKSRHGPARRTGLLNELLTAAGKAGNTSCCFDIFERFAARGTPVNYTTFGILLRNACNAETDARELHRIYRLLTSSDAVLIQMNEHIFAAFIDNFARHGRIDYALAAVDDLRAHPHARYTARHLERIFAYYALAGMGRHALELLRTMVDRDGLCPPWAVYVCTVEAVVRDGDLLREADTADSDQLVDELGLEGAHTVSLVSNGQIGRSGRMLDAFASSPSSALALAALMLRAHHLVDTYTRQSSRDSTRAFAAMSEGEFRELVGQMRAVVDRIIAGTLDVAAPQELYHLAISLFALARDQQTAQLVYDYMINEESMDPTMETFDTLLRSFVRGSSVATATELFRELREQNRPLQRITANILIRGLFASGQPHQAIDVYAYMVGRPTPLVDHANYSDYLGSTKCDDYTFALLISGLVDESLLKEALVVFEDAFSVLPFVPRRILELLASRLEERGMADLAQVCLRRYSRRVEESQPAELQATAPNHAPDRLPLSYFGFLLRKPS
ncbi:hypothetical protein H4R19_001167 [Coemansia spiralis]|nr:hypothetical protein H4R19_001167 [Coemansia spiralis]